MTAAVIPRFFLYGEAPRAVADRFLHLEPLDERTRPANWNIRPHAHANLSHIFFIAEGGGLMHADGEVIAFAAPCLLVLPSNVVHGFHYAAETLGSVLTLSDAYLQEIVRREAELGRVFAGARQLPAADALLFSRVLARLERELAWTAPGHAAAVEALLVTLFVEALRLMHQAHAPEPRLNGGRAALVARFRELLEARFRTETRVERYADLLGASPKRLRAACLEVAGATPGRIIQDRLLLEAKRLLLYSNTTVAEAAYSLGFDDAAYFTRFFTRGCKVSPRQFRLNPSDAVGQADRAG